MQAFKFINYVPPKYYRLEEDNERHFRNPREAEQHEPNWVERDPVTTRMFVEMIKAIRFLVLKKDSDASNELMKYRNTIKEKINYGPKEEKTYVIRAYFLIHL